MIVAKRFGWEHFQGILQKGKIMRVTRLAVMTLVVIGSLGVVSSKAIELFFQRGIGGYDGVQDTQLLVPADRGASADDLVDAALAAVSVRNDGPAPGGPAPAFLAVAPAMRTLVDQARRFAATPLHVLLVGETELEVLAVGHVVRDNLLNLGHLDLKADGRTEPNLPGDVCVRTGDLPLLKAGDAFRITRPAGTDQEN